MTLGRSLRSLTIAAAGLVASFAHAGPPATEQAILAAAKTAEAKLDLELCSYGFLQFDKSQPEATYAYFRDRKTPSSISLRYAIFQTAGKTFNLTLEPGGLYGTTCTGTGDVPKPPLRPKREKTLPINEVDEGRTSTLSVTVYDGQLVYTDETGRRPDPPSNTSWEELRYVYEGSDEDRGGLHKYGTLLVLPKGAPARKTVPKLTTYLVRGQRQVPNDADIDVAAELVGDAIELTITTTDDKDVPLPSATATDSDLLRSDHVELWYQNGQAETDIVQLGLARLANGKVHARWLYPRKVREPLPAVSSPAPGTFVLRFPAGALFHERKFLPALAYDNVFAVVFSDTDDAKNRQETVVASSTLKWGKPETFGKIVWLENGARFPAFPEGSRVKLEVSPAP
jgi:hypothetical protein